MDKRRIQVYTDPETKRRVELAAAKHDMAVTAYCLEAIRQQLLEDDLLEAEQVEISIKPATDTHLIEDLRTLQADILARRGGRPITVDIVEQVRAERDDELVGMR